MALSTFTKNQNIAIDEYLMEFPKADSFDDLIDILDSEERDDEIETYREYQSCGGSELAHMIKERVMELDTENKFKPEYVMAWLHSRSFEFTAFGDTQEEAKEFLKRALRRHTLEYGLNEDWWDEDDIGFAPFKLGNCYRNGTLFWQNMTTGEV